MTTDHTRAVRDGKLWSRLVLVGLTGALPLFMVSLILINVSYSEPIEFAQQEQRGNAVERKLERLLETLPAYQAAAQRALGSSPTESPELAKAEEQVERALQAVATAYRGELGRALKLAGDAPDQGIARLSALQKNWEQLKQAPLAVAADAEATTQLRGAVRGMIRQVGDRSNLILDTDLGSYYLMDITLSALPQTQQRIADTTLRVSAWLRSGQAATRRTAVAVLAATMREADLERIARDTETTLDEAARFKGISPSLAARLRPEVDRFQATEQPLLALLDRVAAGEPVPASALEAAGWSAHAEAFRLFAVGADELDGLLGLRISNIRNERLRGYSIIIGTLAAVAFVLAQMMRSVLASRYAEILKTQDELRAKETRLRALGDNLPFGMVYQVMRDFDGSMRFLYVSAGCERLSGVTVEAALADPSKLYDQIFPEDREILRAAERKSLVERSPFNATVRVRRPDGVVRWIELSSAPRLLADGRPVWDGIQMDVTDRQLAADATKQSELRFSRIFDNSPIPITLSSFRDGKFIAANDSFLRFSGFSREEVIGHNTLELGVYSEISERAHILEQLKLHGRLHRHEQAFRKKSGEICQNILWIDLLSIAGDECALTISLDVTEQRRNERQQRELEEQLRQAQKLEALGTLAGGIAHDFNNILGAIISYSELSKMDNANNAALQANLDEVLKASARAASLVRQILSFSRQQKEERSALQLAPIVKEALSLLRASLPSTIALQQKLDRAVPDVLANATQMHQIIMNLCTNAAHAMKGKQGQISVDLAAFTVQDGVPKPHLELEAGSYVRLTVSDTGQGMDAATIQRIFEPFFTTKGLGEGTGLGLSVVHGIVKEYGGVVTVESELGRGTTLGIYLPACTASEQRAAAPATDMPRGNGERVLFVDDEPVLGDVAQKMLQRLGYRATVFQSSEAALSALQAEPAAYDALITDLTMPGMTGVELSVQVLASRPTLPVILVSGSSGQLTVTELRKMGIRELLSKPLDYASLARVLSRVLRD